MHSESVTDIEMLAYDLSRLGCKWLKVRNILRDLMIANLKEKGMNKHQIAVRIGISARLIP